MSDRESLAIVCGIVAVLCLGVAAVYQRVRDLGHPQGGRSPYGRLSKKQRLDLMRRSGF